MDDSPCGHPPLRSPPFQTRALHFLRNIALRARRSDRKSIDPVPVALPAQGRQRGTRSSLDLLRKPDLTRFIGFRAEDVASPMDTDDSSQDASASGNSPRIRPRRHSTFEAMVPIHSTCADHGSTPLFFTDRVGLGNTAITDNPPPQSPVSADSASGPETPPQINVSPGSAPTEEAAQDTLNDDRPGVTQGDLSHHATSTPPPIDQIPSTLSDPNIPAMAQPLSIEAEHTSELAHQRPALVSYHSAPLPPPFRVSTGRGLRLSPSIITRQPMPLLNLPTLPPPPTSKVPPSQKVPLRHIPSLSRHGYSDAEHQADHEDGGLVDEEEDDGDEGEEEGEHTSSVPQSDDDDDEAEPASAGPSGSQGFKSSQKQRMKDEQHLAERSSTPPPGNIPILIPGGSTCSKFRVTPNDSSAPAALRPRSPNTLKTEDAGHPDSGLPTSAPRLENKPSLYRVASRSLDNLGFTRRSEHPPRSVETARMNQKSVSGHTVNMHADSEESDTDEMVGRLLRRTSMPSFHPTSDPPPYPTFNRRPKEGRPSSREDEGRERLPPYSNALYLLAIMPRKMEFTSPGMQARDRKWRRVVCELEGTALRVYKCPPGASGAGFLGDWWEKRVGVGDVASPNPPRARKKDDPVERPTKLEIDEPQLPVTPPASSRQSASVPQDGSTRRRRESQTSMATPPVSMSTSRPAKRMSGASFLSPFRSASSSRPELSAGEHSRGHPDSGEPELLPADLQDNRSSVSHESTGRTTPAAQRVSLPPQPRSASRLSFLPVATGRGQWRSGEEVPKPAKSDLLRVYTLQHAESGLGNDYLKRKNVIRVRLEGEQFLLQAPDIPAVVEWIEGLHAGTNIALDLDQRPMPKGPMFPRRRRRRPRRVQEEETSGDRAPAS